MKAFWSFRYSIFYKSKKSFYFHIILNIEINHNLRLAHFETFFSCKWFDCAFIQKFSKKFYSKFFKEMKKERLNFKIFKQIIEPENGRYYSLKYGEIKCHPCLLKSSIFCVKFLYFIYFFLIQIYSNLLFLIFKLFNRRRQLPIIAIHSGPIQLLPAQKKSKLFF